MGKNRKFLIILAVVSYCLITDSAFSENTPVVMIVEAKGTVLYSPDGQTWKEVYRNKFLFENWRVKTGKNGTCMLLNKNTEMLESVDNDTELQVSGKGTKILRGRILESKSAKDLAGYFKRKFIDVQKYAGASRYAKTPDKITLSLAQEITLSEDYPEMAWENTGERYDYQLVVGEKMFQAPGSEGNVIRFQLTGMIPGRFNYAVRVLFDGEIIYATREKNKLTWLSNSERNAIDRQKMDILKIAPDNGFLMGLFLDEKGLKIGAMDQFKKFLIENPNSNETRLFLIKVLNELKLEKAAKMERKKLHAR